MDRLPSVEIARPNAPRFYSYDLPRNWIKIPFSSGTPGDALTIGQMKCADSYVGLTPHVDIDHLRVTPSRTIASGTILPQLIFSNMSKKCPPPYGIVKLNDSERGWGVISKSTGALLPMDGLTMRLTKREAAAIALERTKAAAGQQASAIETPTDTTGSDVE